MTNEYSSPGAGTIVQHFYHGTASDPGGGPTRSVPQELRSSPPVVKGSDINNLENYISWLWDKGYITYEMSQRASRGLSSLGYGFEMLRCITKDDNTKDFANENKGSNVALSVTVRIFLDVQNAEDGVDRANDLCCVSQISTMQRLY